MKIYGVEMDTYDLIMVAIAVVLAAILFHFISVMWLI